MKRGLALGFCLGLSALARAEDFAFEPKYPDHLRALRVSPAVCVARFPVRPGGLPGEVEVTGCPEWLAEHSRRQVHGRRWDEGAAPHTATFTYTDRRGGPKRSPEEFEALLARYEPLASETGRCVVEIDLAGAEVVALRSNAPGRCILAPDGGARAALARIEGACELELTAISGDHAVTNWRDCPTSLRQPVRASLDAWRFNGWTPWPQVYWVKVSQLGSAERPPQQPERPADQGPPEGGEQEEASQEAEGP